MNSVTEIVDDYFNKMSKEDVLMMLPGSILEEMLDKTKKSDDSWRAWKPVPSKITNTDLNKFEERTKLKLPLSYREFLMYKYFYRLKIDDHPVKLLSNLPDPELNDWLNIIKEIEISEELLKKGYLYIGDFQDYGFLCFDCNQEVEHHEYPIVYVDHDDIDDLHFYTKNFHQLLTNEKDYGNRFIMKLNQYSSDNSSDN